MPRHCGARGAGGNGDEDETIPSSGHGGRGKGEAWVGEAETGVARGDVGGQTVAAAPARPPWWARGDRKAKRGHGCPARPAQRRWPPPGGATIPAGCRHRRLGARACTARRHDHRGGRKKVGGGNSDTGERRPAAAAAPGGCATPMGGGTGAAPAAAAARWGECPKRDQRVPPGPCRATARGTAWHRGRPVGAPAPRPVRRRRCGSRGERNPVVGAAARHGRSVPHVGVAATPGRGGVAWASTRGGWKDWRGGHGGGGGRGTRLDGNAEDYGPPTRRFPPTIPSQGHPRRFGSGGTAAVKRNLQEQREEAHRSSNNSTGAPSMINAAPLFYAAVCEAPIAGVGLGLRAPPPPLLPTRDVGCRPHSRSIRQSPATAVAASAGGLAICVVAVPRIRPTRGARRVAPCLASPPDTSSTGPFPWNRFPKRHG